MGTLPPCLLHAAVFSHPELALLHQSLGSSGVGSSVLGLGFGFFFLSALFRLLEKSPGFGV